MFFLNVNSLIICKNEFGMNYNVNLLLTASIFIAWHAADITSNKIHQQNLLLKYPSRKVKLNDSFLLSAQSNDWGEIRHCAMVSNSYLESTYSCKRGLNWFLYSSFMCFFFIFNENYSNKKIKPLFQKTQMSVWHRTFSEAKLTAN